MFTERNPFSGLPDHWQYLFFIAKWQFFGNIDFIVFCNSYFFHTSRFLIWQLIKGLFYGNQNSCSASEIYPLFSLDESFSKWTESPPWVQFWGAKSEKTKW